jgi:hypothetical protein
MLHALASVQLYAMDVQKPLGARPLARIARNSDHKLMAAVAEHLDRPLTVADYAYDSRHDLLFLRGDPL